MSEILAQSPIDRHTAWTMLQVIPAYDRETWIQVGMALKSEFGDEGFSLFDSWSQTAANYIEIAARQVWRSFKAGGVTIGTLIYLARQHGWASDAPAIPIPRPKAAPKPSTGDTGRYAAQLWLSADPSDRAVKSHPYTELKGIDWAAGAGRGIASGRVIGKDVDCIIVPVRNIETGKLQAVQAINSDGLKQTFGRISGGCLLLGNTQELHRFPWYVTEGWASGVSVVFHHQKGDGVCAVSFGKHNQEKLAERIAEIYAPDEIIILVEADK